MPRFENELQFAKDLWRNAKEMPEALVTMGTGMADTAGTGLGAGTAMLVNALREGRRPNSDDFDRFSETVGEQLGKHTYMPRSEGGQAVVGGMDEALRGAARGIGAIPKVIAKGGLTAQEQRSPAGRQAIAEMPETLEGINNILGPEAATLAEISPFLIGGRWGKTKVPMRLGTEAEMRAAMGTGPKPPPTLAAPGAEAAVGTPTGRTGGWIDALRRGAEAFGEAMPVGSRGGGTRFGPRAQRGAYTAGDLADVEGNFQHRSTIEEALKKLKPQEQRAKGKQMLSVLKKYGAKEGEIKWTKLGEHLNKDFPVTVDDIREYLGKSGVVVEPSRHGVSGPERYGPKAITDDELRQRATQYATDEGLLHYPAYVTRDGERVGDLTNSNEARYRLMDLRDAATEELANNLLENISDHLTPEQLARMPEGWQRHNWASDRAYDAIHHNTDWGIENVEGEPPVNYDEVVNNAMEDMRRYPSYYNLPMEGKPTRWEDARYNITSPEGERGTDYGETVSVLKREGRYGKGVDPEPELTEEALAELRKRSPLMASRYEAIKAQESDPIDRAASRDYQYSGHTDELNPIGYTREETYPQPPETETPGTARLVSEWQNDWTAFGRKKGFFEPEEFRAEIAKLKADLPRVNNVMHKRAVSLLDSLEPNEQSDLSHRMGFQNYEDFRSEVDDRFEASANDDTSAFLNYISTLGNNIYHSTYRPDMENAARQLTNDAFAPATALEGRPNQAKLPPGPFVDDSKSSMQLTMQQAIMDAVRQGHQYMLVAPGYVHAPESWGTESFGWWRDPEKGPVEGETPEQQSQREAENARNAKRINYAARPGTMETTRGEGWRDIVAALRSGDRSPTSAHSMPMVDSIEDFGERILPDVGPQTKEDMALIDKVRDEIVSPYLSYEKKDYPDPKKFMEDRAMKIINKVRKEPEAGIYQPRAEGMQEAYEKLGVSVLEKILKKAGSKGSGKGVVRNAPMDIGKPMAMVYDSTAGRWRPRALNSNSEIAQYKELAAQQPDKYKFLPPYATRVEIDRELARAAKYGFEFPF